MPAPDHISIRATFVSYVALCGVWVVLAVVNVFLSITRSGTGAEWVAVITGGVAFLWGLWLRGFKVSIANAELEYRDGFFRVFRVPILKVAELRYEWIEWKALGREIKVSRIAVISKSGKRIIYINPKPFSRADLQTICKALGGAEWDN